jgi:hypothetical protein
MIVVLLSSRKSIWLLMVALNAAPSSPGLHGWTLAVRSGLLLSFSYLSVVICEWTPRRRYTPESPRDA